MRESEPNVNVYAGLALGLYVYVSILRGHKPHGPMVLGPQHSSAVSGLGPICAALGLRRPAVSFGRAEPTGPHPSTALGPPCDGARLKLGPYRPVDATS